MKKFTLFLSALLISAMSFAATYTHTFVSNELSTGEVTLSEVAWTTTMEGSTFYGWDGSTSKGIQIGSKNSPCTLYTLKTSAFAEKITSVTVNASIASGGTAKLSIMVGETAYLSAQALTTDATDYTATGSATGDLLISFENDAKAFYIKSITVTYGDDSGENPGENPGEDPGEEPGEDPGEEPGNNDEVLATVVMDFTGEEGLEKLGIAYPTTDAGNGAFSTDLEEGKAYSQNGVSLTAKYGSTATRVWLASSGKMDLRHYKGGVLTFAAPAGKVITQVVFDGADLTGLTTLVDKSWTGTATVVEIPAADDAKTIKINTITISLADAAADFVATPAIAGEVNFLDKTTVSITAEEGLKVYYTLDGTEPTNASTEYTAPFELTATTTVKAVAYDGDKASAVVSKTFTKTPLIGCAEANALAKGEIAYMKPFDIVYVVEGAGYIYIKDETGTALIYSYDWDEPTYFAAGDHVEGFIGKSSPYNGLPELKPNVDYNNLTITKGGAASEPTIFAEAPLATDVHKYVQFNGVKFTESATFEEGVASNATMLVGETEVTLRNAFKLGADFVAEKPYNVVGFVAIFNEDIQVYFLSAEALTTAVDNVTINQNITKFFENGQLVIIKNGVRYNAQGAVVK